MKYCYWLKSCSSKLFKDISTKFSSQIIFTDSIGANIKNQFNQANYQLYNIEAAKKIVELIGEINIDNDKIFQLNMEFTLLWNSYLFEYLF